MKRRATTAVLRATVFGAMLIQGSAACEGRQSPGSQNAPSGQRAEGARQDDRRGGGRRRGGR